MSPIVYEVLDFACGITDRRGAGRRADERADALHGDVRAAGRGDDPQVRPRVDASRRRLHDQQPVRGRDAHVRRVPRPADLRRAANSSRSQWRSRTGSRSAARCRAASRPTRRRSTRRASSSRASGSTAAGELDEAILDIIRANVRLPLVAMGDVNASAAATAIGEQRVAEACERYGTDALASAFDAILDHGEQIARAELSADPERDVRRGGRDRRRRADGRPDSDPGRGDGHGRLARGRLHRHRAADGGADELQHRGAALGLQDGRPRDHEPVGAEQRRLLPALRAARPAGHGLQRGAARHRRAGTTRRPRSRPSSSGRRWPRSYPIGFRPGATRACAPRTSSARIAPARSSSSRSRASAAGAPAWTRTARTRSSRRPTATRTTSRSRSSRPASRSTSSATS